MPDTISSPDRPAENLGARLHAGKVSGVTAFSRIIKVLSTTVGAEKLS